MSLWLFGFFGGLLTAGAMVPQLIKMIRTKSVEDISWTMVGMTLTGNTLWTIYGSIQIDPMIITFASLSSVINISVLTFKYMHRKKESYVQLQV